MIYRFLPNSDWRFDNLCGSHLQSQSELFHVSWWYYTLVIDLIGRLHWQTTPITSRRNWPIRSITRVKYHQLTCYNSLWLWRRLPHRLSKRQSLSTTTVWFRTTFPRTIKLNLLLKWLLVARVIMYRNSENRSLHSCANGSAVTRSRISRLLYNFKNCQWSMSIL